MPAAAAKKTRKNPTSLPMVAASMRSPAPWSLRPRKMRAETPTTNMASVASINGAPSIAPMPIRAPSSEALSSRMATTAIMLSGSAVPTAASRLPTAPWRIPRRPPSISTAFVKKAAPTRIATSATTNSMDVNIAHLLSDGPRNAKKRAIAAFLPADGLARGALALVASRELHSVLTAGPPQQRAATPQLPVTLSHEHPVINETGIWMYAGPKDDNVPADRNAERSERESQARDTGCRPWPRRRRGPDAGLRPSWPGPARRHDRRGKRIPGEDDAQRPAGALPRRMHGCARRRGRLGAPGTAAPHGRGHTRQEWAGRARGDPGGELRDRRKGGRGTDRGHPAGYIRAGNPHPRRPAHQHRHVPARASRPQRPRRAHLPHGREHGSRQHNASGRIQHLRRPRSGPRGFRIRTAHSDDWSRRNPPGRRRSRRKRAAAGHGQGRRRGGRVPGLLRHHLRECLRLRRSAAARSRSRRSSTRT